MSRRSLDERLVAAGVDPGTDPVDAWHRLHDLEGAGATVIDLYDLVGRERGLAGWQLPVAERHALGRRVMPDVWAGYATTDSSQRDGDIIEIVAYDAAWPGRYDRWRAVVAAQLGATALRIEHVGSTSVPGLPAKPIVDVQVSVADLSDEAGYVAPLEAIGLQLRSRDDLHRYFRPFPGRPRDVHVHVCRSGSDWERDHLLFRDYLRATPAACAAYARVKAEAAQRWSDDGIAYTEAKTEMVLAILDDARQGP